MRFKLGLFTVIFAWLWLGLNLQSAEAQTTNFQVVTACNAQSWLNGQFRPGTLSLGGALCVNATVSASITGFQPSGSYANLSAGVASSNVALPTGAEVLVTNLGTNTAYINLGTSSSVTAATTNFAIPAGTTVALTVGSNTWLAAITGSSTSALNMVGGSGLPTGWGGGGSGGGGGGGGAVTAALGAYVDGSITTLGNLGDTAWSSGPGSLIAISKAIVGSVNTTNTNLGAPGATACTTDTASCNLNQLLQRNNQRLTSLITAVGSPLQAGGNVGLVAGTSIVLLDAGGSNKGNINASGQLAIQAPPSLPLPTGASTAANQEVTVAGSSATSAQGVQGVTGGVALPISAASLPLPANAAIETGGNLATLASAITSSVEQTNLKQVNSTTVTVNAGAVGPGSQRVAIALDNTTIAGSPPGPAGTPSASVLSVQGVASMTPLKVDGSAVTQPISAALLPLPTGAATAANQEVTLAGTTAASAQGIQGVTGGVPVPVSGTLSASIGAFAPGNAYAPLSVTTASANVALPTGADVLVYNTGAFDAYIHLGVGSGTTATTSQDLVKSGQALEFAVGSNTYLAAITSANSTTLTISGGGGIFAGVGGGGSGGGGGTVAQGAAASLSGAWPVEPTDGTRVITIKAASTVPVSTDTAQVMTQRPDSATVAGALIGTAGIASANVVTIQGIAGGTAAPISVASLPLPTGAATAANQPTNAAIGSTTSGQTGNLPLGAVTTASPSYTTGQSNPLSLTLAGALRTDSSAVTQPISASALPLPTGAATAANQEVTAAGSSATSAQGVQGVTGGVALPISVASLPLPTGAATAANQPTNSAQGAASSGQTGNLAMAVASTTAPADGNGNSYALSLTTVGALRVDGSAVTQPISASALPLPTGAATSANQPTNAAQGSTTSGQTGLLPLGAVTTSAPTYTTGQSSPFSLDVNGNLRVVQSGGGGAVTVADGADVAEGHIADSAYAGSGNTTTIGGLKGIYAAITGPIAAGTALIGKVGIDQTTVGTTNGVSLAQIGANTVSSGNGVSGTGVQRVAIASDNTAFAVNAQPTPVTSGGLSTFFVQPTASDNHANIKNGAGQVYHVAVTNNSATVNYLRLYNAATGFNGCNSATNLVTQLAIPASTSGAGFVQDISQGLAFSTGISICVSSGYATTDTTSATASAMSVVVGYK